MLLARTDWDVPKHQGITYFALPMQQPGVEVRPLRQMNGHASFNEVFLTDARVPADNMVGEPGDGLARRAHHARSRARAFAAHVPAAAADGRRPSRARSGRRGGRVLRDVLVVPAARRPRRPADRCRARRRTARRSERAPGDRRRAALVRAASGPRSVPRRHGPSAGRPAPRDRSASWRRATSPAARRSRSADRRRVGDARLRGRSARRRRRRGARVGARGLDRRRHRPDPAQHHRRAGAWACRGSRASTATSRSATSPATPRGRRSPPVDSAVPVRITGHRWPLIRENRRRGARCAAPRPIHRRRHQPFARSPAA